MKIEVDGHYAYETGDLKVKVGDVVEVPNVKWLQKVQGYSRKCTVTSLTTTYDGTCVRIIRVIKKARKTAKKAPPTTGDSMKIELKKVKFHENMSDETNCFSADIWVDGKKLASVQNQGTGGDNMEYPVNGRGDPAWLAFQAHCKSLPPKQCKCGDHEFTLDSGVGTVVDDLFSKWLEKDNEKRAARQIKGWCKKKTVYRLKGDPEGSWRTIGHVWDERVKAHLVKTHGDKLEEIANEWK